MSATPDGAQHVLSLPEPAEVLTSAALRSYAVLVAASERADLELALVSRE